MGAGAGKFGKYVGAPIWGQGDGPKKVGDSDHPSRASVGNGVKFSFVYAWGCNL